MENMEITLPDKNFWNNRIVFITGHTGFKGSWLSLLLKSLGAKVYGYALDPPTKPNLFEICNLNSIVYSTIGDIRDYAKLQSAISEAQPSVVIHLAAQPLVRRSYEEPLYTFETNVMGTANLFETVRNVNSIRAVINVTTDKCYENKEWIWPYREEDALGGHDPYSGSKACSEILTASFRSSFFNTKDTDKQNVAIATARAGNVIGGGDWSEDRLISDIMSSIIDYKDIKVRNPNAIRPWQHVLEPLSGYLLLAENMVNNGNSFSEAWNFGSDDEDSKTVKWIVEKLLTSIPDNKSKLIIDNNDHPHEANYLKLDSSKAKNRLNWHPQWKLEKAIETIVSFIDCYQKNGELAKLVNQQIVEYLDKTKV